MMHCSNRIEKETLFLLRIAKNPVEHTLLYVQLSTKFHETPWANKFNGNSIQFNSIWIKNRENISSKFSRNSEADASEFLENLKEMFLCYFIVT